MAGIVISVSVVVGLAGLIGALNSTYRTVFDAVADGITVTKSDAATPGGNGPRSLRDSDVAALRKEADPSLIASVIPMVSGEVTMRHGADNYRATVVGATSAYLQLKHISVASGSVFTDSQYQGSARVVLLGPALVNSLFGGSASSALGSTVAIGRLTFEVIGLLGPDGQGDATALIPMTTARSFLFGGMHTVSGIGILATNIDAVRPAVEQLDTILDHEHYVKDPTQRDFTVSFLPSWLTAGSGLLSMLLWFTSGVTAIALFIGALGLANIMLITVTERTCEIGVRRAIGARRSAIFRQFLLESVMIAGLGGIIGAAVGAGATLAGRSILTRLQPLYGLPEVSMGAVAFAFGISLFVGLISGLYPAIRAARLHPWDALRY
jgi:putative ABC transport system permease protein